MSYLEFLSVAAMKHHDHKANWRGKGLFILHFPLMNYIDVKYKRKSGQELKQGRNLEAGTLEVMGVMLLTGLLSFLCYRIQDYQPQNWHHLQWAGPSSID